MKNHKMLFTSFFALALLFVEAATASTLLNPGEDGIFGSSESHIRLGKANPADRTVTMVTTDPAGESELASILRRLGSAGVIGGVVIRMEVLDINRLSSTANDAFLDGDHKTAFDCYGLLVALDENNQTARLELAKYLIQGIRETLEPKEADRMRASQLLIEASWLEITQHPGEPDHAGRLLKSYKTDVYSALSRLASERKHLEERIKESLQAQLFAEIKDIPADPF